ncbi:DUF354 domain-containing protein [Alsobacter sp. KACC 23698]|uniref:DUF354 domain-containing protein n=1 Tax=Alsobacter sp. KACC 23698 TaxID=3149229 RepID=A0AAU7JJ71_9HYPH
MKVWIDFSTAPDPLFFEPIIRRLIEQGHTVRLTARDYSETVHIAESCGRPVEVVGRHGGASMRGKAAAILTRARQLSAWLKGREIDLALGYNSYAQALAALATGVPLATCMDYEYQPANHLAFRIARRIIVPEGYERSILRKQGGTAAKVVVHEGLKEHVTLVDFEPDPRFPATLASLGVSESDILVTMRPPATQSAYHRFENHLFEQAVLRMADQPRTKVILLPRYQAQAQQYRALARSNLLIPEVVLDGLNLVYWSDAVISAGGSMNREAVVLGTQAATVFAGRMGGVDRKLIADGSLQRIASLDDLDGLAPAAKRDRSRRPPVPTKATEQVVQGLLGAVA